MSAGSQKNNAMMSATLTVNEDVHVPLMSSNIFVTEAKEANLSLVHQSGPGDQTLSINILDVQAQIWITSRQKLEALIRELGKAVKIKDVISRHANGANYLAIQFFKNQQFVMLITPALAATNPVLAQALLEWFCGH